MSSDIDHRTLQVGDIFRDTYEVVRRIASGGMGSVYEVLHRATKRRCALKVMHPDSMNEPSLIARFKQEMAITSDIDSEHIVQVLDAGVDEPTHMPFIVMELLKGDPLHSVLKYKKRLSPQDTVDLLRQVAEALDRTHAAGIVHRDLKPENLFITYRGDGSCHVKILDFGIAKMVGNNPTYSKTSVMGTPAYMSPEQIQGDARITHKADIYALGQLAFTMFVGDPYWAAECRQEGYFSLLSIMRGSQDLPTLRAKAHNVELPEAFDAWFAKATAVNPTERFSSAGELVRDLSLLVGSMDAAPTEKNKVVRAPEEQATLAATLVEMDLQASEEALPIGADPTVTDHHLSIPEEVQSQRWSALTTIFWMIGLASVAGAIVWISLQSFQGQQSTSVLQSKSTAVEFSENTQSLSQVSDSPPYITTDKLTTSSVVTLTSETKPVSAKRAPEPKTSIPVSTTTALPSSVDPSDLRE